MEVGFRASELTHPWYELTERGFEADIASPRDGRVELDAYSDPRHESGYSSWDLISMGFLHTKALAGLLDHSKPVAELRHEHYEAIMVCGGQCPMFSFRANACLQSLIKAFYEAEKPVVALGHGVAALMDVKLSDGSYLIASKNHDRVRQVGRTRVGPDHGYSRHALAH